MDSFAPTADIFARATERLSVIETLVWIANNHPHERGADIHELLRAVALHDGSRAGAERVRRKLVDVGRRPR